MAICNDRRFLYVLIVFLETLNGAIADTEVLMEKPLNSIWGWTSFGNPSSDQGISQWVEEKTSTWVCSLGARKEPAVWLRTEFISVKDANRVDVSVTYRVRPCKQGKSQYCKENIDLYIYHTNKSEAKLDPVKTNFDFVKSLPVTGTGSNEKKTLITAVRPKAFGFYLAILDKGACAALYRFNVSYSYCSDVILNALTQFPRTVAPFDNSEMKFQEGKCSSKDSVNTTQLIGYCTSSGSWNMSSNVKCLCVPGFGYKGKSCDVCPDGMYKSVTGNTECTDCPGHSKSMHGTKEKCECEKDYYRAPGASMAEACMGLPSAPKRSNVTIVHNSSSVTITWLPSPNEHNVSVLYTVECSRCKNLTDTDCLSSYCGSILTFHPKKESISWLNVTIGGLQKATKYKFTVYSVNQLTAPVPRSKWKYLEIFAKTGKGDDTIGPSDTKPKMTELQLILFVAVPVISVIIVLLMIGVCLMWKRSKRGYTMPPVEYDDNTGVVALPSRGKALYIDPGNYDSPEDAVKNFAKELDRKLLNLDKVIGGGEFGDVYSGNLTRPGDCPIPVAIKVLKTNCIYNKKNRDDFLAEASIMGQFCDPNVIFLEGVVTNSIPLMIVTEFMANGSLDRYLTKMDGKLSILQLLGMARGVASGMKYLSEMNFIHRDLAARNILVTESVVCKVADFGLSRELANDSAYETKGGKIPVRWTAPEAINYKKFSTASDVWSYGILLWEIMSFAERPYWDWGNFEVIDRIEGGYRLPPPMKCPKIIHQLMLDCWAKDRTKRPRFAEIVKRLDVLIRSPEKLDDNASWSRKAPKIDYREISTVCEWLNGIKMKQYIDVFHKAGYERIEDVVEVKEQDLLDMGIKLIGHRKKIHKSIQEIRTTVYEPVTPRARRTSEEV